MILDADPFFVVLNHPADRHIDATEILMGTWTVDCEFDQPIRHVNQNASGGSFVAIFTLRMIPDLEIHLVSFDSRVNDEEAIPWMSFIEEEVRDFQKQRAIQRKPIGHLRVELVSIRIHPVDSNPFRFKEAALMSMSKAFDDHEIDL